MTTDHIDNLINPKPGSNSPDEIIRRPPLPEKIVSDQFLSLVLDQFELQGHEPNGRPDGGHPDPVIRSFYRAAHGLLSASLTQGNYFDLLNTVHQNRPGMDETFFTNLWFRAVQHVFRQRGDAAYVNYKDEEWSNYFNTVGLKDIDDVKGIMSRENTATHVLERYRSFNTAIRLTKATRIADIGCSLGLGLKACLAKNFLSQPQFIDDTPGKQVLSSFQTPAPIGANVVGIDIRIPTLEWVKACNYPSRYDQDGKRLDQAISTLSVINARLVEANVLDPNLPEIIWSGGPALDMIHSSMAMYELPPVDQQTALNNISHTLKPGGIFVEFTFKDPKDWFKGVNTLVMVNTKNGLSPPLIWHEWNNSRCTHVWAGKDFDKVNHILC